MDIREIARKLIEKNGLINLTRYELARAAGILPGSFSHFVGCSFTELVDELAKDTSLSEYDGMIIKPRVNPALRKSHILKCAMVLAAAHGYNSLTRAMIAEEAGVSEALVSHYFGTMDQIRDAIMHEAVKENISEIILQGMVDKNSIVMLAPPSVRKSAIETFKV